MDEEDDGFVLVPRYLEVYDHPHYISDIEQVVVGLDDIAWTLSCYLHDNPEIGFAEYKAHDALTDFMKSHEGWKVRPSAYGMDTAWVAVYDTGRPGPVVAFNAEMGRHLQEISAEDKDTYKDVKMHFRTLGTRAVITS
jgi:metal-dependent amidase/aminoacylase/carboxypeptidase family protein